MEVLEAPALAAAQAQAVCRGAEPAVAGQVALVRAADPPQAVRAVVLAVAVPAVAAAPAVAVREVAVRRRAAVRPVVEVPLAVAALGAAVPRRRGEVPD